MGRAVSVVISLQNPGEQLAALLASLDRQTLSYEDFSVAILDRGSTDGSTSRLERLRDSRPNISLITGSATEDECPQLAAVLDQTEADIVQLLFQGESLLPQAMERLAGLVDSSADLIIGRRVDLSGAGSPLGTDPNLAERPGALGLDLGTAFARSAVAGRRQLLAGAFRQATPGELPRAVLFDLLATSPAVLTLAHHGQILASGPVVGQSDVAGFERRLARVVDTDVAVEQIRLFRTALRTPSSRSGLDVRLSEPRLSWRGSTLHISLNGVIEGGESTLAKIQPAVVLFDAATREELGVPTTGKVSTTSDPQLLLLTARAALDPTSIASGGCLRDGMWSIKLRLVGDDTDVAVQLPAAAAAPALLEGWPIRVGGAGASLDLDAGATHGSLIGPLVATNALIKHGWAGSLLLVDLPQLHSHGAGRLNGHLFQDRFSIPGVIVAENGAAELRCYVSALSGSYLLSAKFGGGSPVGTGLNLNVSGLGAMSISEKFPVQVLGRAAIPGEF